VPLFVHGPSGSGKSAVLRAVVDHLKLRTAVVDCLSCASPRLVYESALDQLHAHTPSAINGYAGWCTCETSAVFVAGLREALEEYGQVCIIFDHAAELLKYPEALALLLSLQGLCQDWRVQTIFVAEAAWESFHWTTGFADLLPIRFPSYTSQQLKAVLLAIGPPPSTDSPSANAFANFVPLFIDYYAEICTDVHELRYQCWQAFSNWLKPVRDGLLQISDTEKLLFHAKHKGGCLREALAAVYARDGLDGGAHGGGATQMPLCAKYLLLAAHMASRYPAKMDVALFSAIKRSNAKRRTKRAYAPADDPINFSLDRLFWIYSMIRPEALERSSAELLIQLNALVRKKLLTRVSRCDDLDVMRFRCASPFELVKTVALETHFDLQPYVNEA